MDKVTRAMIIVASVFAFAVVGWVCYESLVIADKQLELADFYQMALAAPFFVIAYAYMVYVKLNSLDTVPFIMVMAIPAGLFFSALSYSLENQSLAKICSSLATIAFSIITGTALQYASGKKRP